MFKIFGISDYLPPLFLLSVASKRIDIVLLGEAPFSNLHFVLELAILPHILVPCDVITPSSLLPSFCPSCVNILYQWVLRQDKINMASSKI